jgi:hypothetical protein
MSITAVSRTNRSENNLRDTLQMADRYLFVGFFIKIITNIRETLDNKDD